MSVSIVFTFIGADKPGLIKRLAETVNNCGGNWLESRMSQLAGQFAGIARIQADSNNVDAISEALSSLSGNELSIYIQREEPSHAAALGRILHLSLVGNDRPGIIHELSSALADYGINVCEMNTNVTSAPMSGEPLFEADAEIQIPEGFDLVELSDRLDEIANQLAVDINLDDE